ncbi:MAG TPA: STAS domain-containing protein [Gemmataceae bacterium]|nr:STAS domain-containing protein [Gemmataceae bacterium]
MAEPSFHHLQCRTEQGVLIATLLTPELQSEELAGVVRDELHQAIDAHKTAKVIVDFQHVRFLGSAGFRPLISLYRRLQDAGGRLILCGLSAEVARAFAVTRLIKTGRTATAPFEVTSDQATALRRLTRVLARKKDGVLVLTVIDDKLQGDELVEAVRDELLDAVTREDADRVVLDLGQVEMVTSAGIRPLLALRTCVKERAGRLVLCGLRPMVTETLQTTRLITTSGSAPVPFPTAPDVAAAIALLSGSG